MSVDVLVQRFSPLPEDLDCEATAEWLRQQIEAVDPGGALVQVTHQDTETAVTVQAPWGRARLSADGGEFSMHEVASTPVRIIYLISAHCDMVIVPAFGPSRFILTSDRQRDDLPAVDDFVEPVVCGSADELGAHLSSALAG